MGDVLFRCGDRERYAVDLSTHLHCFWSKDWLCIAGWAYTFKLTIVLWNITRVVFILIKIHIYAPIALHTAARLSGFAKYLFSHFQLFITFIFVGKSSENEVSRPMCWHSVYIYSFIHQNALVYINISIAIFIYVLYGTWDCSSQPLGVFQTLWAPYLDSYLIHLILFSDLNLFESVNG